MGPFQEYEEKKFPEKGSPRSRIPRLVLLPCRPKDKDSPLSDSPVSEEEGKECDVSSDHSKRTISTNSFSSGSDHSPQGTPPPPERRNKVKRVRVMAEWIPEDNPPPRHKREQRPRTLTRGSEADFSSSSSAGSLKARELQGSHSTGRKISSRSRGVHIRSLPVFKPAGITTANRDAELYAPYRTPPKAPPSSTNSSSNSSPTSRRVSLGRYQSCGDNHGIRPPHPEQYLTPLQQKEVAIRHLKGKLRESENVVHDRDMEVEELKGQLGRMREDWIEEECHRVEAQLSLKEARKEIKQLRQVVETMRGSLMEKDKGIHKYFIDINIQNRKLESLLHSMELAQSGSTFQVEPTLDFIGDDSPGSRSSSPGDQQGQEEAGVVEEGAGDLEDQAAEVMADSGLLVNDELASRTDILEHVLMSTAMETSQDGSGKLGEGPGTGLDPGVSTLLLHSRVEEEEGKTTSAPCGSSSPAPSEVVPQEKGIQTEVVTIPPDLLALLLQLLKHHGGSVEDALLPVYSCLLGISAPSPALGSTSGSALAPVPKPKLAASPPSPSPLPSAPQESPATTSDSGLCQSQEPKEAPEVLEPSKFMQELDFTVSTEEESCLEPGMEVVSKSYWSSSFLVDLVAVAAPVLPTVAWLYSRHGIDGRTPVYNIASLIRGCCIMGLHSLRHVSRGPNV
ncbi:syntabulin [Hypomesus transpacificus]|uniref:syntabulin n=1 Tax=Hypomesus transpacificus TaxID=137520 RepID=UPI001F083E35|nr:syntabulin [Hypomesus transpacificus]